MPPVLFISGLWDNCPEKWLKKASGDNSLVKFPIKVMEDIVLETGITTWFFQGDGGIRGGNMYLQGQCINKKKNR